LRYAVTAAVKELWASAATVVVKEARDILGAPSAVASEVTAVTDEGFAFFESPPLVALL